ncbi:MAG: hypothetical protein U0800_17330 [Isosphaeraceae bacterium]
MSVEDADEDEGADLAGKLMTLLESTPVLALEQAARDLGEEVDRLERVARSRSGRIGLLGGPPATLFRRVDVPSS